VSENHRRRGIGEQLVRAGLSAAERQSAPLVMLEGDPRYYRRMGFVAASTLGLRRPSLRIPEEGFQARPLSSYEPWMTGTMVYPDLWWRYDLVGLRERTENE
jgi:putative acetyltransferase